MWLVIFLVDSIVLKSVIEMYFLIFRILVVILLGVILSSLIFLRCCFSIERWLLMNFIMFVCVNLLSFLFRLLVMLVIVLFNLLNNGWKFLFVVVCLYSSESVFVIFFGVESIIVVLLVWWVVVLIFIMCMYCGVLVREEFLNFKIFICCFLRLCMLKCV